MHTLKPLLAALSAAAFCAHLAAQETASPGRSMPASPQRTPRTNAASGSTELVNFEGVLPGSGRHPHALNPNLDRMVVPPPLERCTVFPDEHLWKRRDILREMQSLQRRGMIPVIAVPPDAETLRDASEFPSGWKAYGLVVPAHGRLTVKLDHLNRGWFRLIMVNREGRLQEGMLQNLVPKGEPVVTFKNSRAVAEEVFVIADDPGWMSSQGKPYTLTIGRDWDPREVEVKPLPDRVGIWARRGSVSPAPGGGQPSSKSR